MDFPRSPIRRILSFALFLGLIFVVGGIAGVVFEREFIPRLATMPAFQNIAFLKHATDSVTIINKTEQIQITEDNTVERIISQPATAVVNIIAVSQVKTTQRTGVLLTNDGLVATYDAAGALEAGNSVVTVLLFDGTSHEATFFGFDRLTNLLYYRIQGVNTPAIALANSEDTRIGQKLIAVGNSAVEYQNSLLSGVLSNKNRTFNLSGKSVASSEKWEGVFEMDSTSAQNFIGGPAINYNGEMEGIIGVEILDGQSHSFIIPSNAVRSSLDLARAGKLVNRPELGVYYLSITKAGSIAGNLSRDRGALIYSASGKTGLAVLAGSPAERAGLRNGDIVIAVNGKEINLDNPLSVAIGSFQKGDTIELLIVSGGAERTISVSL